MLFHQNAPPICDDTRTNCAPKHFLSNRLPGDHTRRKQEHKVKDNHFCLLQTETWHAKNNTVNRHPKLLLDNWYSNTSFKIKKYRFKTDWQMCIRNLFMEERSCIVVHLKHFLVAITRTYFSSGITVRTKTLTNFATSMHTT
jgi:hypothetical protein